MQACIPSPVSPKGYVVIHVHGLGQHADQDNHNQWHYRAEWPAQDKCCTEHGNQSGINMQGIPGEASDRKNDEFNGLKRCDFHALCAVLFNVLFLDGIRGKMDLAQEAEQPCNQRQHGHDE